MIRRQEGSRGDRYWADSKKSREKGTRGLIRISYTHKNQNSPAKNSGRKRNRKEYSSSGIGRKGGAISFTGEGERTWGGKNIRSRRDIGFIAKQESQRPLI